MLELEAPACPWWCTAHMCSTQPWDVQPGSVTKLCRRVVQCDRDVDGEQVAIVLERFASGDGGHLQVADVVVRVLCDAPLSIDAVGHLSGTLGRVAEMSCEPSRVA